MGEHFRDIPQFVRFQSMTSFVLLLENLLKRPNVLVLYLAKTLRQLAEEFLVRALLGATIEDHVAEFLLLTRLDLHLQQLVRALLKIQR